MEPKVLRITESFRTDPDGTAHRTKLVHWMLGPHGPFLLEADAEGFDPAQVSVRLQDEALKLRQLLL